MMALSPSFFVFGIATTLLGIGAGMYYNPATMLIARNSKMIGRAIGYHRVGGQIAGVAAPLLAGLSGLLFGWRSPVVISAGVIAIVVLIFFREIDLDNRETIMSKTEEQFSLRQSVAFLSRKHVRSSILMMAILEFAGLAAMAFLPTLLIEQHGLTDWFANVLFAIFFVVSALSQPLNGWTSDLWGRDSTIIIAMATGVIGFGALSIGGSEIGIVGGVALAGVSMGGTPVIQSRMLDGLSIKSQGPGFGVFRTTYLLLGGIGTFVVGSIADLKGWGLAVGLLSAMLTIAMFVAMLSDEPSPAKSS
jgi:predicted MFS family arabinose efflux permease